MSKRLIYLLILFAGFLILIAGIITIASRALHATDTASRPRIVEVTPIITVSAPLSDEERIRNELLSLGLAIDHVDFLNTLPVELFSNQPTRPDVTVWLASDTSYERS